MIRVEERAERAFESAGGAVGASGWSGLYSRALFVMLWYLSGCLPSLYMIDSFRQAQVVPVVEGMIALDRGESIEIKEILAREKRSVEKVLVTKLKGRYLLTAEGFKQIWVIIPSGEKSGKFFARALPDNKTIRNPRFLHSEQHGCVTLLLGAQEQPERWQIHASGYIARRCDDVEKK